MSSGNNPAGRRLCATPSRSLKWFLRSAKPDASFSSSPTICAPVLCVRDEDGSDGSQSPRDPQLAVKLRGRIFLRLSVPPNSPAKQTNKAPAATPRLHDHVPWCFLQQCTLHFLLTLEVHNCPDASLKSYRPTFASPDSFDTSSFSTLILTPFYSYSTVTCRKTGPHYQTQAGIFAFGGAAKPSLQACQISNQASQPARPA